MALSESIRFAGDVQIDKVEIVSTNGFGQNITNQVSSIQIFEDLFSPFITGNIIVDDTLDLMNLFPFIGEEFLNLKVKTPSFDAVKDVKKKIINDKFYIYKATERELLGDKRMVYRLHFISVEAIIDLNKRISSAYEGKCSDIVSRLVQSSAGLESKKTLTIEDTPNGTKFVSNYWSPIKCINYVADQAFNINNSPSYLFFENREGYNFVSAENLAGATTTQEFIYDKYTREIKPNGQAVKNVEQDYKRIEDISIPQVYDYMERTRKGMFSSKMITHDLVTKKYSSLNYDMLSNYGKEKHLNAHPIASKSNITRANSAIFTVPKYYGNFNGYADVTNTKIFQKRISLMQQLEANKIEIVVAGRTDYTVGQRVYVKLFKMSPLSQNENIQENVDRVLSGYYLIAAINHYITRERHECNMELIKDSLIMDLDKDRR